MRLKIKKVMIIQPMGGLTKQEILDIRIEAKEKLESHGYEVADTLFDDDDALKCLGKSLEVMADCDAVYMCENWHKKRGCIVEHLAACSYGKKVLYYGELK